MQRPDDARYLSAVRRDLAGTTTGLLFKAGRIRYRELNRIMRSEKE